MSIDHEYLKLKQKFDFINVPFGYDDDRTEEGYPCAVAESAHQIRNFILEVSCEVIGKDKVIEVHQLNRKIEHGINICSGYAKHISSLLTCLASLLTSADRKEVNLQSYRKELTEVIVTNKIYLLAALPLLTPYIQTENLMSVLRFLEVEWDIQRDTTNDIKFNGLVAMVVIPSYAILLNLSSILSGCTVDVSKLIGKIMEYVHHGDHLVESGEFVQKCASTLYNEISSFTQQILKLDDLCAPVLNELISY